MTDTEVRVVRTPRRRFLRLRQTSLVHIVLVRILIALLLVLATYNPSGISFGQIILAQIGTPEIFDLWPLKLLIFVLLVVGWVFCGLITMRAMGGWALALAVILVLVVYIGIDLASRAGYTLTVGAVAWLGEIILAVILGFGLSWGYIYRKTTGLTPTDEVIDEADGIR